MRAQGKTVIIAEHRLYYIMDAVYRVVYLENGKIAGDFTPEQLMSLTKNERQSMGLRNTSLRDERPMRFEKHEQKPAVLEVENIALAYKKQPILRSVSLKAEAGEVIAVVGHNGAGKTTFSRALCGLHKEESGVYLWKGKPQKPKDRMKLSYMVMQDVNYQLFAERVEAECTFGIKRPDLHSRRKRLTSLDSLSSVPVTRTHSPADKNSVSRRRLQWSAARSFLCSMSRRADLTTTAWCGYLRSFGDWLTWKR